MSSPSMELTRESCYSACRMQSWVAPPPSPSSGTLAAVDVLCGFPFVRVWSLCLCLFCVCVCARALSLHRRQDCRWDQGKTFGFVYHGDEEHVKFLNEVYAMYSQTNPLHLTAFPSVQKMEQEVLFPQVTRSQVHTITSLTLLCGAYRLKGWILAYVVWVLGSVS